MSRIICPVCEANNSSSSITCDTCGATLKEMSEGEDTIKIKIHGSEAERQEIVDRICVFMTEQAEKCMKEWGTTKWGWTLESSREPELDL